MIEAKTQEAYDRILKNISAKGRYAIEYKGQRTYIRTKGFRSVWMQRGVPSPDFQQNTEIIKPLFSEVRNSVTRYIKKNNFSPALIEAMYSSRYTNNKIWGSIKINTQFYHIDACHCYWRTAFVLGYIGKKIYEKYVNDKNLKMLRNISLSVLNSKIKVEYYEHGTKYHEINCDISLHSTIYNNIRHYAYNNSGTIKDAIPECCINYRVDGIYLLAEGLEKAKSIFTSNGLLYKITKMIKVDDKHYSTEDGEIKKML